MHASFNSLYSYGDSTPFRVLLKAEGPLRELLFSKDPMGTGAYAGLISFEELFNYHADIVEYLKFVRDNPQNHEIVFEYLTDSFLIFRYLSDLILSVTLQIQRKIFLQDLPLANDNDPYAKYEMIFKPKNENVKGVYVVSAEIEILLNGQNTGSLTIMLGTSKVTVPDTKVKHMLSEWSVNIETLISKKILTDLKLIQSYITQNAEGNDALIEPPVLHSIQTNGASKGLL